MKIEINEDEVVLFECEISDVWSLDITLAKIIYRSLEQFLLIQIDKNYLSYPSNFSSWEEWKEIVNKMIVAFKLISEFEEDNPDKITEGLELFTKYYLHLWM